MDDIPKRLEKWFEKLHAYTAELSAHWREHVNRRTIVMTIVGGAAVALLYLFVIQPPENFPAGELVTVSEGESIWQIASDLEKDGVIRSPLFFELLVGAMGSERQLRAGDYLFKEPENVFAIARAISLGAYGLEPYHIRIIEGTTAQQMADIYDKVLPRFDRQAFLAAAKPQEGYLFPDTYFFLPNATADTVLQSMRQNFDSQIATVVPQIASSSHSLSDIIIMASIIEREAPDMADRRLIAGVLWRRLKLGMPLQSDVTSVYTLAKGESLTAATLRIDTPYNTYLHKGLPPSPIGNPSLEAIIAAATPIDKGYLFYLADRYGVTHYCKTYSCQLANQRAYLRK